jgi:hypothetical protein
MEQIICDVREQGLIYYDAIDMSIGTAEAGYAFSTEAIDLCDELLEPTFDLEELQKFVTLMQDTARKAHKDSKATLSLFDKVRTALIEVRSLSYMSQRYWQVLFSFSRSLSVFRKKSQSSKRLIAAKPHAFSLECLTGYQVRPSTSVTLGSS